jgi:hypothetical protein
MTQDHTSPNKHLTTIISGVAIESVRQSRVLASLNIERKGTLP